MIEVNNLTKYFGDLCAVDYMDMHVENGIFRLLGPNGAGKSTIVRILATLPRPTEGTARICGHDVAREPKKVRSVISYVTPGDGSRYQAHRKSEHGFYTQSSAA